MRTKLRSGALAIALTATLVGVPTTPAHANALPDTRYEPVSLTDMVGVVTMSTSSMVDCSQFA